MTATSPHLHQDPGRGSGGGRGFLSLPACLKAGNRIAEGEGDHGVEETV